MKYCFCYFCRKYFIIYGSLDQESDARTFEMKVGLCEGEWGNNHAETTLCVNICRLLPFHPQSN